MAIDTNNPSEHGQQQSSSQAKPEDSHTNAQEKTTTNAPQIPSHAASGTDQHEIVAIIGYILPFLFFLPFLGEAKNNTFAKFHANQQLNLLLFEVIGWGIASFLTIVLIGLLLMPLVVIASVVLAIMGIINVVNGEMKPLPLIGKYQLIK